MPPLFNQFFIFILLFFALQSNAQITLKVVDENALPLPFANIELKFTDGKPSNFITASNENGVVNFEKLSPDNYYIIIHYISYKSDTIRNIQVLPNNAMLDLGTVALSLMSESLAEFEVQATRPVHIEKANGDRAWLPPKAMALNNDDVLKMLRTIPGVTIDLSTNTIKINGKEAQVLINSRSFFNDKEVVLGYLASLTPADIKEVQLLQASGAKFDAEAAGGVINIITHKSATDGINGNLYSRYRQGHLGSNRSRASLNWKHQRFSGNVFYHFDYYQGLHDIDIFRRVTDLNTENAYFNETAYEQFAYLLHKPQVLVNFDINSNNRIGMQVDFKNQTVNFPSFFTSGSGADSLLMDSTAIFDVGSKEKERWPAVNFNYSTNIKGKGSKLDFAYDFFHKDMHKLSVFDVGIYNVDQTQLLNSFLFRRDNNFIQPVHSASIDFKKDLKRSISIDIGTKLSILTKESNTIYDEFENDEFVNNPDKSESFDYRENIYAGYINFLKSFNDWKVNLGVRIEHSNVHQNFYDDLGEVEITNFNVFPSINFFKEYGKDHSFRMGYNRGLNRPKLVELLPFTTEISPFLTYKGSPTLQPQIDNIISLEFIFAQDYSLYANYNVSNRSINSIFIKETENLYNLTYSNFDRSHFFNMGFSAGTDLNEWWSISADVNFYYDLYNATLEDTKIKRGGAAVNIDLYSQFILPKSFFIDVIGTYNSPRFSSIELFKSGGQLDVGLSKHFFDNKLTLKIQGLDILKTQKVETQSDYLNLFTKYVEFGDTRRFDFTVTYRFNKGAKFKAPTNIKSNTEIENRSNQ
jgi:hypothetical protein